MTRYKLVLGTMVAAFALSVLPATAQRPGGGGEGGGGAERPSGGGGPGGGGPGGGGSGGGPVSSGGGGGSVSSGGGGESVGSPSSGGRDYGAPSRPESRARGNAPERRGGGERAISRGSGGETRGTSRVGSASSDSGGRDRVTPPADRAVPAYSRPREGRTATGTVVDRQFPPRGGGRTDIYYYPYYSSYYSRYFWPGYGFGLGYYSYDPLWFDPYYDPYFSGGYYGGSGGYGYQSGPYRETGSLRLKLKPRDAKVYIDGYFVGVVDSFDGLFQKLGLEAGGHRVEVRADGYEPLQFEVLITPGESVTYKGELKRIP